MIEGPFKLQGGCAIESKWCKDCPRMSSLIHFRKGLATSTRLSEFLVEMTLGILERCNLCAKLDLGQCSMEPADQRSYACRRRTSSLPASREGISTSNLQEWLPLGRRGPELLLGRHGSRPGSRADPLPSTTRPYWRRPMAPIARRKAVCRSITVSRELSGSPSHSALSLSSAPTGPDTHPSCACSGIRRGVVHKGAH